MSFLKDNLQYLLAQTQSGDQEAYRQLLSLLYPYIRQIVKKRVFNANDVDDVTQEVLTSIHRSLNTYDAERAALPWINAITQRRIIDYIRKNTRISSFETTTDDGDVTFQESPANILTEDFEWLNDLSPDTREALVLTKIHGYSTSEAAHMVGVKENALRTRVSRGLKKIKSLLKAEQDEK